MTRLEKTLSIPTLFLFSTPISLSPPLLPTLAHSPSLPHSFSLWPPPFSTSRNIGCGRRRCPPPPSLARIRWCARVGGSGRGGWHGGGRHGLRRWVQTAAVAQIWPPHAQIHRRRRRRRWPARVRIRVRF